MSRSTLRKSCLLVCFCMLLLAACTGGSPWAPARRTPAADAPAADAPAADVPAATTPAADAPATNVSAAGAAASTPTTNTVAILVVDYFSDPLQILEEPQTEGGESSPATSSGNCVTEEQVYWAIWTVIGGVELESETSAGASAEAEANVNALGISHGDIVLTEVVDLVGANALADTSSPTKNGEFLYHGRGHDFLVRRVQVAERTTQAVADALSAAVGELRSEGIHDFVINMSFVMLPCDSSSETAALPLTDRINNNFALLNTLPPFTVDGNVVPSPVVGYLSNQLVSTLSPFNVSINNYQSPLSLPPVPEEPHSLPPQSLLPTEPPLTIQGRVSEVDSRSLNAVEAFNRAGAMNAFDSPTDVNIYPVDALPVLSYPDETATNGAAMEVAPGLSVADSRIGGLTVNPSLSAMLENLFVPVTYTLSVPTNLTPTTESQITMTLDTAPQLTAYRILEAYTLRSEVCAQFPPDNWTEQRKSYCTGKSYMEQINEITNTQVISDPLFILLKTLHSDPDLRVISVGASGNFGKPYPFAPASWPNVISVGAISNRKFMGNGSEVLMSGVFTLPSVLRADNQIVAPQDKNKQLVTAGTSVAAPRFSVLAALYLASGGALDCSGADSGLSTHPPLNYADGNTTPPTFGNWENLSLAEARQKYCALFPSE